MRRWVYLLPLFTLWLGCVGDDPTASSSSDAGTSNDAGPNDSAVGTDSAAQADTGADTGPSTACTSQFPTALFCDDFDTGAPKAGWTTTGDPGQIVNAALAFSAPNGFRFATPMASVKTVSDLSRDVSGGTTEWALSARVHVDTFSGSNAGVTPPTVLQLQFGASDFYSLVVDPFTDHAHCGGLANQPDTIFQHASWHRVTIKLTVVGADLKATCTVDGNDQVMTVPSKSVMPPAKIHAGITAFSGQGPFSIAYDDIVFEVK